MREQQRAAPLMGVIVAMMSGCATMPGGIQGTGIDQGPPAPAPQREPKHDWFSRFMSRGEHWYQKPAVWVLVPLGGAIVSRFFAGGRSGCVSGNCGGPAGGPFCPSNPAPGLQYTNCATPQGVGRGLSIQFGRSIGR